MSELVIDQDGWPQNLDQETCEVRIAELRRLVVTAEDELDRKRDELAWYEEGQRLGLVAGGTSR